MIGIGIAGLVLGIILTLLLVHFFSPNKLSKAETRRYENQVTSLGYENSSLQKEIGSIESILNARDKELEQSRRDSQKLKDLLEQEEEKNKVILSQKKSSEIRTGHIVETLAPLLMNNHDPKRLRWLGYPVDFIAFDEDRITLIEVKSGKSQLSHSQKRVKHLVRQGKVFWEEIRLKGNKKGGKR